MKNNFINKYDEDKLDLKGYIKDKELSEIINFMILRKLDSKIYKLYNYISLLAVEHNRLDVLKHCIDNHENNLSEMLALSIIWNHFNIFKFLINNITHVDKHNIHNTSFYYHRCLKNACKHENYKVINYILKNNNGIIENINGVLHVAYHSNKSDKMKIYLNYKAYLMSNKKDHKYIASIFNVINKDDKKSFSECSMKFNTLMIV